VIGHDLRLVIGKNRSCPEAHRPFGIGQMPEHFLRTPFPGKRPLAEELRRRLADNLLQCQGGLAEDLQRGILSDKTLKLLLIGFCLVQTSTGLSHGVLTFLFCEICEICGSTLTLQRFTLHASCSPLTAAVAAES